MVPTRSGSIWVRAVRGVVARVSRDGRGRTSLVPIADRAPDRYDTTFATGARPASGAELRRSRATFAVVSSLREGAEVFNTYGALGNATLLNSYGFTRKQPRRYRQRLRARCARGGGDARRRGPVVADGGGGLRRRGGRRGGRRFRAAAARSPPNGRSPLEPPTALLVALWAVGDRRGVRERRARAAAGPRGSAAPATRTEKRRRGGALARRRRRAEVSEDDLHGRGLGGCSWRSSTGGGTRTWTCPRTRRRAERRRNRRGQSRILVESARAVVDAHAAETAALAAFRGVVADELDDAKRREPWSSPRPRTRSRCSTDDTAVSLLTFVSYVHRVREYVALAVAHRKKVFYYSIINTIGFRYFIASRRESTRFTPAR